MEYSIIVEALVQNQPVLDTIYRGIVDNEALQLYNTSFDNIQASFSIFVNKVMVIITILGLFIGVLSFLNFKSSRNSKKEFENTNEKILDLEKKLKEQLETQKNEIKKFKATSYFTDSRDSQTYRVVEIGNQTWMAENLNYDIDGSKYYDNDPVNDRKYGRLYNWKKAKKACPEGWHLPSNEEWEKLMTTLGDSSTAGAKLKTISGWNWNEKENKSGNGIDEFGFAALPGGLRFVDGIFRFFGCKFSNAGYKGVWWSATEIDSNEAYSRVIDHSGDYVFTGNDNKSNLLSFRCIKN